MATSQELTDIVRALNKVQSAGQVRVAIGAALNAIGATYPVLDRIADDDTSESLRGELDSARVNLERWIKMIYPVGGEDYRSEWAKGRNLVEKAYVVIAGVEGAASYKPRTSFLSILAQSISEAPKVFGEGLGAVVGAVGEAAGKAAAGVATGLGLSGWIFVIVAAVVALAYVKRVSILGRVGRVIGVA
jgi:hypothetical protein